MKKKELYEAPRTKITEVELENGFMSSASIFDPENQQDDGVTTEGHDLGNTGTYDKWDFEEQTFN